MGFLRFSYMPKLIEKLIKYFFKKVLTSKNISAIILTVQHAGVAQWQSS